MPARTEPPAVWRRGVARLLDYSGAHAARGGVVLLVPSLINRYYILDLYPARSLARYLARSGTSVLVMDWGVPSDAERGYDCADYVSRVLLPAVDFLHETAGGPVTLAGYCMGGVLALAAAQLRPSAVERLALLASPWDFCSADRCAPQFDDATLSLLSEWLESAPSLAPEALQMMFYWMDPWLFQQKFRYFAQLSPDSTAYNEFLALEQWVNDGVPLVRGAAKDCLIHWGQRNALARGRWKVGGQTITPGRLKMPVFIAAPTEDRIVPPGCAEALGAHLHDVTFCRPAAGHVGMMVGHRARAELWEPLARWIKSPA